METIDVRGLVSVIIPTFEHGETIGACIDSALNQTYGNIEVIVVNDGSTDNTRSVLEAYKGKANIVHQLNKGSNPARNRGLQEARGEYVIFVDADVRMESDMIRKMLNALGTNPEASFAYCGFKFGWKTFKGVPFDGKKLRKMNYIHTTSLVRKKDFPGFDENIRRLQDWDVWLTMLEAGKYGVLVPEVLFSVEISGASRIGSSWLPSFMYKIPWSFVGWRPMQIKKYEQARDILRAKHQL